MDEATNQIAARANLAMFDAARTGRYVETAPHLKHESLRRLYGELILCVFNAAKGNASSPTVLDLGAGEGSTTLPFLELGAYVTAVDISESQLDALLKRCRHLSPRLEVRQQNVFEALKRNSELYDIVVMNSFLHHVPGYLGVIKQALRVLRPHGQFVSFQDPLRYDTVGWFTLAFTRLGYFSWRIFQGNLKRGLKTRIRRIRGIYLPGSEEDDAEYHVTRNGVDQDAIARLLAPQGFTCRVVRYFSSQNSLFQPVGTRLGLENTFAIVAQRIDSSDGQEAAWRTASEPWE